MTNELFPHYADCISDAIGKANTKEKQVCCNIMIDHLQEDYSYKHFDGKEERIQALRDHLQEKHNELLREISEHNKNILLA